ncbi:DUF6402 family protein [Psychrobacter alimentarius]|uniref:DUF6402 family protein n=1 Tax=Psychrobacter alimentarius TaxID=261164 RepID=UPI001918F23B|nr:DUF6402 family protein [Psychrobacter alimentarius]
MTNDYNVLVTSMNYNTDGTITVRGTRQGTKEAFTLICTAEQLCRSTLTPNNSTNQTSTSVPLFKLSDIPSAMREKGSHMAAYLNEKWLNDRSLEMNIAEKGRWATIRPSLILYKPDIFNHQWLKKFERYNNALDDIKTNITSDACKKLILKYFKRDGAFRSSKLKKLSYSSESNYKELKNINSRDNSELKKLQKFHENWQCQKLLIDDGINDQLHTFIKSGFKVDDLWATFGSFAIYAAIGNYRIIPQTGDYYMVYIESIICYAIDSYDFIITPDDYLGHWNKKDFDFNIILKNRINNLNTHRNPRGGDYIGSFNPNNLLYPIYNHHYQEYRKKYQKGKDMVVWTKPEIISMKDVKNKFKTFVVSKSDILSSL